MADKSKIEWTDATWTPITGCSLVSEGCRNCYAAGLAATRLKNHPSRVGLARKNADGVAKFTGEVRFNEQWLDQPLRWRRGRKIFVCAHGDLFHESVPDEWIDRVFAVMALCPQHTFQVLTKRPERMRDYLSPGRAHPVGLEALAVTAECYARNSKSNVGDRCILQGDIAHLKVWPLTNVWLGVSVEDQATADERIPLLLDTPAAKRFISAEPLLGPLDLYNGDPDPRLGGHEATQTFIGEWWEPGDDLKGPVRYGIDWVVVGGESGLNARPMHADWVRSLRDQCTEAQVPFFFKQWGEFREFDIGSSVPDEIDNDTEAADSIYACATNPSFLTVDGCHYTSRNDLPSETPCRLIECVGKKAAGHLLDGREHREFPA